MQWGCSPSLSKELKYCPYLKNKDKLDITNYRPISILPIISKVYEKVFYNRLYNYFSVNNLLSSSQFGFRSGASTEHALLKFSHNILKLYDQKKDCHGRLQEFRKTDALQISLLDHNKNKHVTCNNNSRHKNTKSNNINPWPRLKLIYNTYVHIQHSTHKAYLQYCTIIN